MDKIRTRNPDYFDKIWIEPELKIDTIWTRKSLKIEPGLGWIKSGPGLKIELVRDLISMEYDLIPDSS